MHTTYIDVTMLSASGYFNFTPLLAGCAVGTLEFRCAVEPVRIKSCFVSPYNCVDSDPGPPVHTASSESIWLRSAVTAKFTLAQTAYQAWCDSIGNSASHHLLPVAYSVQISSRRR